MSEVVCRCDSVRNRGMCFASVATIKDFKLACPSLHPQDELMFTSVVRMAFILTMHTNNCLCYLIQQPERDTGREMRPFPSARSCVHRQMYSAVIRKFGLGHDRQPDGVCAG